MTSLAGPQANASGVVLRRSTRLSRSGNAAFINTETTSLQETNDASVLSRRLEMVASMNLDVTENELKGLDTSILDSTIVLEIPLHEQEAAEQPRKTSRKRKRGKKKIEVQVNEDGEEFVPEKKLRKKRAPKPEPVYIIPDVERKETTFKGRLGYACLNTVLRNKRPASESVFCSRTCRLDSLSKNGMEWVKDLGRQNVRDLITMIQWNEDNQIRFLRLSSEMFPFASHGQHGYSLDYCAEWLKEAGDLANKYGHRLTTHPGQFTQLGSPKAKVIDVAVRELEYHCQMLDIMGVGADGVMIVHGGGTYGDKASAVERIKNTISEVLSPKVRARLVLENDEMCYNAEDLLAICEELDVPLVFDYHHDMLNPSSIPPSEIIKRADAIWKRRGIRPKQHLSEPRPGAVTLMERRAHADRCDTLPPDLPDDMDLMIEAKDKEQAVFHLYRIYGLAPVIHANLRPPNPNPTKETNGRKSNKRTTRVRVAKLEENGALGSNDELLGPRDDDDRFLRIVPSTEDVMDDGPLTPIESPNIPNSVEGQRLPGQPCVESCGEEKEVGEQQQQKRRKYKADLDEEPQEQDDIAAISSKKRVRRRSTSKNEDSDTNRSRSPQLVRDSITSSGT